MHCLRSHYYAASLRIVVRIKNSYSYYYDDDTTSATTTTVRRRGGGRADERRTRTSHDGTGATAPRPRRASPQPPAAKERRGGLLSERGLSGWSRPVGARTERLVASGRPAELLLKAHQQQSQESERGGRQESWVGCVRASEQRSSQPHESAYTTTSKYY